MLKNYIEKDIDLSKKQKISIVLLTMIFSGVFGWLYEIIFYFFNSGMTQIYMRGSNFLPSINIYTYGSILIILFTYKKRKSPLKVFLISVIVTGLLEYLSGYILYGKLGMVKCWDYNQEILNFGNIGGYVCLRSVLFFGLSGLFLIYVILPSLIKLSKKVDEDRLLKISIIIFSIFMIDELYNLIFAYIFKLPRASDIYKKIGLKYIYFS